MFWKYLKGLKKIRGSPPSVLNKKMILFFVIFLFAFFISGCSTLAVKRVEEINIDLFPPFELAGKKAISPQSVNEYIPDVDILHMDDNLKTLIEEGTGKIMNPQARLSALTRILIKAVRYDTVSDLYGVKTAQQTFDSGTANCLSFSNLFVAASRHIGFDSSFSEIPTLPNWSRDGEILFFTRHIGAYVDVRQLNTQVIQLQLSGDDGRFITLDNILRFYFYPTELLPERGRINRFNFETITDRRAFSQYYNNLGSKYLAEGDIEWAYRYFIKAIKIDPGLSFAWSNLGVMYKRNNQLEAAEAAYLQGISVIRDQRDTSLLSIMNNLARLYEIKGDADKASYYKEQVAAFREKNPYYQYAEGKAAYQDAFYEKSIGFFREAIRLKKDEHLFYYGLALAYMETGDLKKAEQNINNAITHAWDQKEKKFYQEALESLKVKPLY